MKRMSLGRYRVFSPNNADVRSGHFNDEAKAWAYYHSLTMGKSDLADGTQVQLLDTQTGQTLDWGRFLRKDEDPEELLRAWRMELDTDESAWAKVETELPNGTTRIEWVHKEDTV